MVCSDRTMNYRTCTQPLLLCDMHAVSFADRSCQARTAIAALHGFEKNHWLKNDEVYLQMHRIGCCVEGLQWNMYCMESWDDCVDD